MVKKLISNSCLAHNTGPSCMLCIQRKFYSPSYIIFESRLTCMVSVCLSVSLSVSLSLFLSVCLLRFVVRELPRDHLTHCNETYTPNNPALGLHPYVCTILMRAILFELWVKIWTPTQLRNFVPLKLVLCQPGVCLDYTIAFADHQNQLVLWNCLYRPVHSDAMRIGATQPEPTQVTQSPLQSSSHNQRPFNSMRFNAISFDSMRSKESPEGRLLHSNDNESSPQELAWMLSVGQLLGNIVL